MGRRQIGHQEQSNQEAFVPPQVTTSSKRDGGLRQRRHHGEQLHGGDSHRAKMFEHRIRREPQELPLLSSSYVRMSLCERLHGALVKDGLLPRYPWPAGVYSGGGRASSLDDRARSKWVYCRNYRDRKWMRLRFYRLRESVHHSSLLPEGRTRTDRSEISIRRNDALAKRRRRHVRVGHNEDQALPRRALPSVRPHFSPAKFLLLLSPPLDAKPQVRSVQRV